MVSSCLLQRVDRVTQRIETHLSVQSLHWRLGPTRHSAAWPLHERHTPRSGRVSFICPYHMISICPGSISRLSTLPMRTRA